MTACPSCLRALQRADHRDYRDGRIGCGVRELAHMPQDKREQAFDVLLKECGRDAHDRVREDVRMEMARIEKLRGQPATTK